MIYILGIIGSAVYGLIVLGALVSQGGGAIVLGLIFGPLVFVFGLIFARVMAEMYLIMFKIEENTRQR